MTFSLKKHWRTTSALCFASVIAVTTAAYAASHGGHSDWDKRPHPNHHNGNNGNNGDNDGHGKDHDSGAKTASPRWEINRYSGEPAERLGKGNSTLVSSTSSSPVATLVVDDTS